MKITFQQQAVTETEIRKTESHPAQAGRPEGSAGTKGAFYAQGGGDWTDMPARQGEKGKSLIELQQEASNIDVSVQQDYMTLMSNTMSEEDYAKLQEEGFDFGSMEPEEALTIVDRIKAELVRSGKQVTGYTDDLDVDTLTAALGSQALAQAVADSFREADVPLTRENVSGLARAWNMAAGLHAADDGSLSYLIDNEMEAEIWNLYLAQNSGAGRNAGSVPRFYAEDVQGYYARSADTAEEEELTAQIDRVLSQSGRAVNEENRQSARWLLEKGLPLTEENLDRLEELSGLQLPVGEEEFARRAAAAVAEGKDPVHARLTGETESCYEKAVRLLAYYQGEEAWEATADNITARRQLEEIRLRMTAEVNVKLLKSGFSIDTEPMERLVEALRAAERELAGAYFPQDADPVSKYETYRAVNAAVAELPGLPAHVLGSFAEGQATETLEEFHREGKALQETYAKAGESYEALMTAPRKDLGDSIQKAFANVDDILKELGQELTEENRRAARILGYNRMELTAENLERVKEADRQVCSVIEKLTPAATLKMIRDGVNPLEESFASLEKYFDSLPEEYQEKAESYSRFLYGLERNKAITQEERESYIGIYRLVRQIEKSDGAVVGALVNTQAELHFSNLLSAVRSRKAGALDVKVSDELGVVSDLVRRGESISGQILKAFVEVSYSAEAEQEYNQAQLEQYRNAVTSAGQETVSTLKRGEIPENADNLLVAQALTQDAENIFAAADKRSRRRRSEQSRSETLWQKLDDKQAFVAEYRELAQSARETVEEVSLEECDNSVDVRGMQLVHKQLTVLSSLERNEEYFIPMYVGDVLTRVHLTFDRNSSEKGSVQIGVNLSTKERIEAQLSLNRGEVQGIFSGQTQAEVMKLEKIADTFREEAQKSWAVGNISVVNTAAVARTTDMEAGGGDVENVELYRMAKVFLQAVQQGVGADEN